MVVCGIMFLLCSLGEEVIFPEPHIHIKTLWVFEDWPSWSKLSAFFFYLARQINLNFHEVVQQMKKFNQINFKAVSIWRKT